jgi:D-glycero-alpha-D-manno-heptose-7-phosphate kinase
MGAIVARAPLRVALGGGGTDLPTYYREHGGLVISTAIDRYVHMVVTSGFQRSYRLKHLEWEEVDDPGQVRHPILREALSRHWDGGPVELASVADAPPGTGLGSSGAYAVCAINALRLLAGEELPRRELAEQACHLEIELLGGWRCPMP